MFRGIVERPSHERGLLVSFSGASPALGSKLVDGEGRFVGIVDSVLGHVEDPLLHLKLKMKADPAQLIGLNLEVQSRERTWNDRKRDNQGRRSEDRGRRDKRQRSGDHGGDWTCPKCDNSNFSFRTECNRCQAPKSGGGKRQSIDGRGRRDQRGGERQSRDRGERRNQGSGDRGGDWTCPKCDNSNFAFRTECNRCQAPKSRGGGGRGKSDNRGRKEDYSRGDDRPRRGGERPKRGNERPKRGDERPRKGDDRGRREDRSQDKNRPAKGGRRQVKRRGGSGRQYRDRKQHDSPRHFRSQRNPRNPFENDD